ncbi:MAG TPA: agenet domain-containing protein [Herpetosiphonaceae bacterium]
MADTLGWSPERTWVFVVGALEWERDDIYAPFPKAHRRDQQLVDFFREQQVPDAHITYLQDRAATTAAIKAAFERLLAACRPGDLLVLYYCGHGAKTDDGAAYFASYDADDQDNPGWAVDAIPRAIERHFEGSHALLLADCCYSGCLSEAVGRRAKRVAYACLTSSLASELSTGNWTFTEGLLAGFRGQAFADGDGNRSITLQELAHQMMESMAFAEEQAATFAVCGGFDPQLVVAAARPASSPQLGKRIEVKSGRGWYPAQIVDADGELLKVHFYGYDETDDEWVDAGRIREAHRPVYPVGAQVEVLWKRKWYPATVKDVHYGVHYIQYDDYDESWGEWVALKRIRQPE